MTRVNSAIFRKYDVRGVVGRDLDEGVAEALGRAYGTMLRGDGEKFTSGSIAVGRDVRQSSVSLAQALVEGIVSTGWEVIDLGIVPTPVVYFTLWTRRCAGGSS
jgi:phosphomannomutase